MARTIGSSGEKTEAAIRAAAIDLIAKHGFEAVSMRDMAKEVGVGAAAFYRYFPNKEELLFTLMEEHMTNLIASWNSARPAASDAGSRLSAFIDNHVRFHVERRHSTHVSNMELRSLSKDNLTIILKMRTSYEKELRQILRDGQSTGEFTINDVGLTAMAIIQMITGVIVWFRPDDRLSIDEVSDAYHAMTMRLVGASGSMERADVHALDELRSR